MYHPLTCGTDTAVSLLSKASAALTVACAAVFVRRSREKKAGPVLGEAGFRTPRGGEAGGEGGEAACNT